MDRLFKKRTNSVRDPRRAPSRQNSADSHDQLPTVASSKLSIRTTSSKRTQKGRARLDAVTSPVSPPGLSSMSPGEGSSGSGGVGNGNMLAAPPSLDMDFRHSLLLPGLSQRFSVLLPSLSSIPEKSLRPLLASQRQRNDLGPAITEEEEEMIFAELQDLAHAQKKKLEEWADAPADNPIWSTMNLARWEHGANIPPAPSFGASMSTSPDMQAGGLQRISEMSVASGGSSGGGKGKGTGMSGSISTPNLLDMGSGRNLAPSPSAVVTSHSTPSGEPQRTLSPPPTSTSFDSLSTFISNGSDSTRRERDERAMARSRGHGGFGGGTRMQEDAYLRRTRKESERNMATSMSSRSISDSSQASSGGTERGEISNAAVARKAKGLSPISAELANADWNKQKSASPASPASDRTATPTSAYPPSLSSPTSATSQQRKKIMRHSPSSSLSLNLPPQPPIPTSPPPEPPFVEAPRPPQLTQASRPPLAEPPRQSSSAMGMGRAPKQRKSMLSVLSDAQLKRISLALFEIGKELEAMGIKTTDDTDDEGDAGADARARVGQEEVLEGGEDEQGADLDEQQGPHDAQEQYGGQRQRVDSKSESGHSTGSSSVFPYHVSPTTSSFATGPQTNESQEGAIGAIAAAAMAPTLGRIPASPKILDLHAHVSPPPSFEPLPPPATTPNSATSSTAAAPLLADQAISPFKQSVIIQEGTRPKPILTPTRTLPVKHTPSDSFDGSTPVSAIAIPGYVPGQLRPVGSVRSDSSSRSGTPVGSTASIVSQEHTPTPASRSLPLPLSRSQSVQTGHARNTPTPQDRQQHQRNASLGYVTDSWRSASPLAQMSRSSAANIEEEDDEMLTGNESSQVSKLPSASASGDASPRAPSDEENIRVQQVVGKHSVARSRSDAKQRHMGKAFGSSSGTETASGGVSASPSLLDVPEASRPKYASHQSHHAAIEGGSECSYAASSQALGPSAMSHESDRSKEQDADERQEAVDEQRRASVESTGSCYKGFIGFVDEEDNVDDDYLQTPEIATRELEAVLGISKATMAALQGKLVIKAKAEREAFRAEMGDSPALIMSPSMSASDLPAVPVDIRAMSPLASQSASIPMTTPTQRTSEASPVLGEIVQAQQGVPSAAAVVPTPTETAAGPAAPPDAKPEVPVAKGPPHIAERSTSITSQSAISNPSSSLPQSRKPSQGGRMAPQDDPDVVRDFEARIAAATAALQRQPSISGPGVKLERKGTKRGAMKISSPTLVSSSSSISGAVLSPTHPESAPAGPVPPSSFKSKPAHKMSLKWKNAFKRGPSISSSDKDKDKDRDREREREKSITNPALFSPPVQTPVTSRNVSTTSAMTTGTTSSIASSSAPSALPAPGYDQSDRAKTPQPAFGDFRFPASSTSATSGAQTQDAAQSRTARLPSTNSTGSIRSVLGLKKRGKSDEAVLAAALPTRTPSIPSTAPDSGERPAPHAVASAPALQHIKQAAVGSANSHKSTPSDDSAVAKFIAAGRALGLSDEQMNEMLAAKGMLNRSGSSRSNGSAALTQGSTASHASPSPMTPGTGTVVSPLTQGDELQREGKLDELAAAVIYDVPRRSDPALASHRKDESTSVKDEIPVTKKEGLAGLVRALSKKRAPKTDAEHEEHRRVVRRTILMPESLSHPTLYSMRDARDSFASPQRSPRSQVSFSGGSGIVHPESPTAPSFQRNRQNSIRRKPIALTAEEEQMLSDHGSPVAPGRRVSMTENKAETPSNANAALGFLAPDSGTERRPSGASGNSGKSVPGGTSGRESMYDMYGHDATNGQQGIEITEYEDGRMVWNVVDGLRDDDDSGSDYTESADYRQSHFQPHSRETSFASERSDLESPVKSRALGKEYKLPLRHRDRGANQARPQTNLYFTSPTDVADLIDQLSQDPDAAGKGRIDFSLPSPPPVPDLPTLPTHRTPPLQHGRANQTGQFEDAPSPGALSNRRSPPAPINVGRANQAPAGGWSPKRQAQLRQAFGRAPASATHPAHARTGSGGSGSMSGMARIHQFITPPGSTMPPPSAGTRDTASPGADSLGSLDSPASAQGSGATSTRNVEDRLQALMDRLVKSGAVRQA